MIPLSPKLRLLALFLLLLFGMMGCVAERDESLLPPTTEQIPLAPKPPVQFYLSPTSPAPLIPKWRTVYGPTLHGVDVSDDGKKGWAVGEVGVVYRYNGSQLTRDRTAMELAQGNELSAIWVSSSGDEAWIVGEKGCVLHYAHDNWERDSSAESAAKGAYLSSVVLQEDGKSGFITGSNGTLLTYGNQTWSQDEQGMAAAESAFLAKIAMATTTGEVWVLASSGGILHFDTHKWVWVNRTEAEDYLFAMEDIAVSADGSVGYTIGFEGEMQKLGNGAWTRDTAYLRQRKMNMSAVWISPDGQNGWAAGEGNTQRWNGKRWVEVDHSGPYAQWIHREPGGTVKCIHLRPDGKMGWAVGKHGKFSRFYRGQWQDIPSPDALQDPYSFSHILYSQDGKRLWFYGNSTIEEYKNGRWLSEPINLPDSVGFALRKMWRSPKGDRGWAVGSTRYTVDSPGRIFFYDGTTWQVDSAGSTLAPEGLNDLWMNSAGTIGWAVGSNATLLRFNGTTWEVDSLPFLEKSSDWRAGTGTYLYAIAGSEDGQQAFAFGSTGTVLTYNGIEWKKDAQSMQVTGDHWITEAAFYRQFKRGFAASLSGHLFQYNGRNWSSLSLEEEQPLGTLNTLQLTPSGNRGWLLAGHGILRWNGTKWENDVWANQIMHPDFSFQEYEGPTAMALHPNGKSGWALDPYGDVYKLTEQPAPAGCTLSQLTFDAASGLPSSLKLAFKTEISDLEVSLHSMENDSLDLFSTVDSLATTQLMGSGQIAQVSFTDAWVQLQGKLDPPLELSVRARLHPSLDLWQTYSTGPIRLKH